MKNWRIGLILISIFIVAAIIIGRLFYLQVFNYKFYLSQALGQQSGFQETKGNRGEVFLQNSKESSGAFGSGDQRSLAVNNDSWIISAIPKEITDENSFADILGKEIDQSPKDIISKLSQSSSYVVLEKNISNQEIAKLGDLKLAGLHFEDTYARYYPQQSLASQVIGFVGGDGVGQYGIEGYYDNILQGKTGVKEEKKGLDFMSSDSSISLNGSDLSLAIDYNIQFEAESLLAEAKNNIDIDSGQIIVMKPDSGRILAMANFPSFNPNEYSKENDFDVFQNVNVQKVFEPGSVFKPFTMAMGLEEGKITPETTFIDTGVVKIGPDTVHNFNNEKFGKEDMSGILEKSINTGAVFVEQKLPHSTFLDYVNKLGFDEKTGIDLQGEASSKNDRLKNGSDFDFATAAFGQGIEMTPIQLAKAFCIFANGGKMPSPYIVDKITNGDDEIDTKPEISDPIFSQKTISQVDTMLINVVEKGYGDIAKIKGYYLAGKTGTAEIAYPDKKGYYPDRTIQSFIGFGPALKPEFLILVKLDNPKVSKAALSAAPLFKEMSQYMINYWQIPPDY